MIPVTLYTKSGCSLCEVVKAELQTLQVTYPHSLSEIDITQDQALLAKYRYTIPVVRIGTIELQAPITAVQLADALSRAASP